MILISHRGNINGKNEEFENLPDYVKLTLEQGFDVEIDIWFKDHRFWLGHKEPLHRISTNFLFTNKLWIHCKNIEALDQLYNKCNCFYHQKDDVTLTSHNFLWTYPGKKLFKRSIAVLPELASYAEDELKNCAGICSDFIINYT